MEDFLTTYKAHIIWVIGVVATVFILRALTNLFYKWLLKKERIKFPREKPATLILVKKILNVLWLVLGGIALSFVFVDRDRDEVIAQNFGHVLYLGVLAVLTIAVAETTNMWFKKSIQRKISNKYDPTSAVSSLLCRLSRRYFLSGQGKKSLHSRSYGTIF